MELELGYTPSQLEIFFNIPKGTRYLIVTKGRRFGATKGASNAFIEWMLEGQQLLWGDTISSNIDRYIDRYFKPELIKSEIPYSYSTQKKVLQLLTPGGGYTDFRSADRPENWEGFGYNKIFLNEAGIILKNDYLYTNAVLPMLMDFPDSLMIAAGVPKGKFTKQEKEHRFYALYKSAKAKLKGFHCLEYSSYDNPLLSASDIEELASEIKSMNPEMEQQEIYGKFVEGADGELWDEVIIEKQRVRIAPAFKRIVVAIDPAVSNKENSDETGIIVCGLDGNNKGYVLEDGSGKYSPEQWATVACQLVEKWGADCIVAEKNQGGDMVETIIRQINKRIRIKLVHATKGKFIRAEPVYALYEQGNIFHVGLLPILERQMCMFTSDSTKSPDRADALVWGFTELMLSKKQSGWSASSGKVKVYN